MPLKYTEQSPGYLLEGMACIGGCVAGAGTIAPVRKATDAVNRMKENSDIRFGVSSKYMSTSITACGLPILIRNTTTIISTAAIVSNNNFCGNVCNDCVGEN